MGVPRPLSYGCTSTGNGKGSWRGSVATFPFPRLRVLHLGLVSPRVSPALPAPPAFKAARLISSIYSRRISPTYPGTRSNSDTRTAQDLPILMAENIRCRYLAGTLKAHRDAGPGLTSQEGVPRPRPWAPPRIRTKARPGWCDCPPAVSVLGSGSSASDCNWVLTFCPFRIKNTCRFFPDNFFSKGNPILKSL